jgi:hypothetical protein
MIQLRMALGWIKLIGSTLLWAAGSVSSAPPIQNSALPKTSTPVAIQSTPAPVANNATPMEVPGPKKADAMTPQERIFKMRDPFLIPDLVFPSAPPEKPDLERYPVKKYKMIGVLTGPNHLRALIETPDNKTYFVAERMRLGVNQGIIKKIAPTYIRVREKFVNVIGQEESLDIDIKLPPEINLSEKQPKMEDEFKKILMPSPLPKN